MVVDVFERDLQNGTTTLISVNLNGSGPGNSNSYSPILSRDGRFVLFRSQAQNLAPGSFWERRRKFIFARSAIGHELRR